jgi:activator of HSP90 ATPase
MAAPIHQEVDFRPSPKRGCEALTDAKQFSAFKCFGGQITGRMTELVPSQKIVQSWHVAMWPEGANSMVRFELKPRDGRTRLVLNPSDFPPGKPRTSRRGMATDVLGTSEEIPSLGTLTITSP